MPCAHVRVVRSLKAAAAVVNVEGIYGSRWRRIDNHSSPADHVVRGIAAHRARVDEPGAFGIRPEPAAAILRHYGGQTRRAPGRGRMRGSPKPPRVV
jgi:hypothetical protein